MCVFSLKTCVFVTSEGQKNDYYRNLFRIVLRNMKHIYFRNIQIYGNYRVIIGLLFSRNLCFDSDFNRIFDYVHGTHCLNAHIVLASSFFLINLPINQGQNNHKMKEADKTNWLGPTRKKGPFKAKIMSKCGKGSHKNKKWRKCLFLLCLSNCIRVPY